MTIDQILALRAEYEEHVGYSKERVPLMIAPEVRERLNNVLYSPAFMGTGVGFSAFIDHACAEAERKMA